MPTTTLKLSEELGRRVAAVVEGTGQSAHAFMVEAIERQTQLRRRRPGRARHLGGNDG
jgi:predicted transcriptional regulator